MTQEWDALAVVVDDEPIVEGVIDDMSMFFGPFQSEFTISFEPEFISPEVIDILFGTDTRTVEGEVVQMEVTDGR
jgi:hypothetical protein